MPGAHKKGSGFAGGYLLHYNGAAQVTEDPDGRTRIVWIADLLPDSAATAVDQMMEQGMSAMRTALNRPTEE